MRHLSGLTLGAINECIRKADGLAFESLILPSHLGDPGQTQVWIRSGQRGDLSRRELLVIEQDQHPALRRGQAPLYCVFQFLPFHALCGIRSRVGDLQLVEGEPGFLGLAVGLDAGIDPRAVLGQQPLDSGPARG